MQKSKFFFFGKVSVGVVKSKQVETVAIFSPSQEAVGLMEDLAISIVSFVEREYNRKGRREDGGKHLQSVDLAHIMFNANLFRLGRNIF